MSILHLHGIVTPSRALITACNIRLHDDTTHQNIAQNFTSVKTSNLREFLYQLHELKKAVSADKDIGDC
jgi:hypothetical protein